MRRGRHHGDAGAAAVDALRSSALQFMQARALLAPWIDAAQRTQCDLPSRLKHGPLDLLQRAAQLAESPHSSAKLMNDVVIFLTYGATYLQDHSDETRTDSAVQSHLLQRAQQRKQLHPRAERIQATWRTQRFHTHRLPPLDLPVNEWLQQDVAQLMEDKRTLAGLTAVPVKSNATELKSQVIQYAAELKKRVEARRRDEDERQFQEIREQRAQEDRRKRMLVQKKKRFEHACRRWNYFTTRLLRKTRGEDEASRHLLEERRTSALAVDQSRTVEIPVLQQAQPMSRMQKSTILAIHRKIARRFVAKSVARGVSRAMCTFNMDKTSEAIPAIDQGGPHTPVGEASKVLRIGLLLCDLHFGAKYSGLYQRFFDRAATERGVRIEWSVFNCIKSQLPTKAQQRVVNGFLVAGGPNIGVVSEPGDSTIDANQETDDRSGRRRSIARGELRSNNRHFGPWRQRLLVLLRDLYAKKTVLGGLGLGHVILAEALGGRVGMKDWDNGWNLLDPAIFDFEQSHLQRQGGPQPQGLLGLRFLHGEFVHSMGSSKSVQLKVWKHPTDQSFVTCLRDKQTLSIDGSPECGSFVFETLNEFYERDKANRRRNSSSSLTRRASQNASGLDDDDDEGDQDEAQLFRSAFIGSSVSLEEKRKRLGATDASVHVARLFLDHFHRKGGLSLAPPGTAAVGRQSVMSIAGVLCSTGEDDLAHSITHLGSHDGIEGVFLNVLTLADGHLVVTNPSAFATVIEYERRTKELKRSLTVSSGNLLSSRGRRQSIQTPTLQFLREQNQRAHSRGGSSNQLIHRSSIRLPSITREESSPTLVESSPITQQPTISPLHRASILRRTSTLASSRVPEQPTVNVLTLSQALSLIIKSKTPPPCVYLRFLDEECRVTHELLPVTRHELRTLWLRLVAAIRIADLPSNQIAIVSRHSVLLEFMKRKRPTWVFVKDCRRSEMNHRVRLQKVAQYAAIADIVLFDQDFVLSDSANENEAIINKAHELGLEVFVAPRIELLQQGKAESKSPRKLGEMKKKESSRRAIPTEPSGNGDHDIHLVEMMLLQFSGLDGVITARPLAAIDARVKIATKSDVMQQVEQIFRDWRGKDIGKNDQTPKHNSQTPATPEDATETEGMEDYVGGFDSDDSLPENEIIVEMTRQWAEHTGTTTSPVTQVAQATAALSVGSNSSSVPVQAGIGSVFLPFRPLQPKSADQVLGVAAMRRQASTLSGGDQRFTEDGRSRLRSIGSFRPTRTQLSSTSLLGPTPRPSHEEDKEEDSLGVIRSPETAALPVEPSHRFSTLKLMRTKKLLLLHR